MTRILIADDHPSVRRGVKQILAEAFPQAEIGEASTAFDTLEQANKHQWSLIVLDLTMPGRSGLETLQELKASHPEVPVLILSMHPEDQFAVRAVRAGAAGYLTKESVAEEMVMAARKVLAGGRYIRPSVAELLAVQLQNGGANLPPHNSLSDREFQVMNLMAKGKTVTAIADELCLSVKSISTYRARILEKLKLHSTADLIRYALEHRLVE
ncbi:DNA-binding response regulator [Nitrospira sp.]|nr:DNA-binding response regulator [Nitrospira sp.]